MNIESQHLIDEPKCHLNGVLHIPVGGNQGSGETDLSVASTFHDQRPMSK